MNRTIIIALMLLGSNLCITAQSKLSVKVDERVELVSIFSKIYGFYQEGQLIHCSEYADAVDKHFNPQLRNIYSASRDLRSYMHISDFNYEALIKTALSLTIESGEVRLNSKTSALQELYDKETVDIVVKILNDFYKVTSFRKFYESQQNLYCSAENFYSKEVLNKFKPEIYEELYDESMSDIRLYIAMTGADVNFSIPQTKEIILGPVCCSEDAKEGFLLFNTPLENLVLSAAEIFTYNDVLAYEKKLKGHTDDYYRNCAIMFDKQHYRADDILFKQMAILGVIYYNEKEYNGSYAMQKLEQFKAQGFMWTNELWNLLNVFKNDRERYPYFKDYLPVLADKYRDML